MTDPGATLAAFGYDAPAQGGPEALPLTRKDLDQVSTRRPVVVWSASEHIAYANSALLKQLGITATGPQVRGLERDPDGEPTGVFTGIDAARLVLLPVLQDSLTPAGARKAMRYVADLNHQGGITTMAELELGMFDLKLEEEVFYSVFQDPDIPLRIGLFPFAGGLVEKFGAGAVDYARSLRSRDTDRIWLAGMKFMSDDAFLDLTMQLNAPGYVDGHHGLWNMLPSEAAETMLPWWEAGFDVHVHSNGDASQDATLDALQEMLEKHPRFDHRFTLEHLGLVTPAQIRRMKALGAVASVNGYYIYYRGELNERLLGADRSGASMPQRSLLEEGIPMAIHSDTPVAPAEPLRAVWSAVTRKGQSGRVLGPAERITRQQAFEAITIGGAYVMRRDHLLGSIEAGKYADFAVLAEDPFEVDIDRLPQLSIWGTVLGGKKFPSRR